MTFLHKVIGVLLLVGYVSVVLLTLARMASAQVSYDPDAPQFWATAGYIENVRTNNPAYNAYLLCETHNDRAAVDLNPNTVEGCAGFRFHSWQLVDGQYQFQYQLLMINHDADDPQPAFWHGPSTHMTFIAFIPAYAQTQGWAPNDNCLIGDGDAGTVFGNINSVCPWEGGNQCPAGQRWWFATSTCVPEVCTSGWRLDSGLCGNPCASADFFTEWMISDPPDPNGLPVPNTQQCLRSFSTNSFLPDDTDFGFEAEERWFACNYNFTPSSYDVASFPPFDYRIYTGSLSITDGTVDPPCYVETETGAAGCLIFSSSLSGACDWNQSDQADFNPDDPNVQDGETTSGGDPPPDNPVAPESASTYWAFELVDCDSAFDGLPAQQSCWQSARIFDSGFEGFDHSLYPGTMYNVKCPIWCDHDWWVNNPTSTQYSSANTVTSGRQCDTSCQSGSEPLPLYNSGGTYGGQIVTPSYVPGSGGIGSGPSLPACDGSNDGTCYCETGTSPPGATSAFGTSCTDDGSDAGGSGSEGGQGGSGSGGDSGGSGAGEGQSDPLTIDDFPTSFDTDGDGNSDDSLYEGTAPETVGEVFGAIDTTTPSGLQGWLNDVLPAWPDPSTVEACPTYDLSMPAVIGMPILVQPPCQLWIWLEIFVTASAVVIGYFVMSGAWR